MEAHVKIPLRMVQTGFMVCLALAASILGAMAQDSKVNTPKKVAHSSVFDTQSAYCTSTGGLVEVRHAVFGTNGPENTWLKLAGQQGFCQYTASDGSRIHLNLSTQQPTLAALAYYAEVPPNGGGEGNPASFYCTQLGGAEIGATDLSGGGWVSNDGGIDEILEACIFPDNSTIDSWGLFYHSDAIIRGVDLSTVLRYANPYTLAKKK